MSKLEQLRAHRGSTFDTAYMDEMVKEHEKDLERFRQQADGGDSRVDEWAEQNVPVLERHLERARDVKRQVERGEQGR